MLNAAGRENSRRRSDNPNQRGSVQGADVTRSRSGDGSALGRSPDDHLERNVPNSFLNESKGFDGFLYMLRRSDHPLAESLRKDLFPQLALALEAALRRAAEYQMDREVATERKSIASSKGKSFRHRAYFPEGSMESSDFDIVKVLGEELKKYSRGAAEALPKQ
ncbi:Hypothetical protein, putative [Bodo saltans]|uniref:Uncharacterized protein n=1 Tax=Bodo saltans TaxID=75058 RepID=A0A0S4JIC0_BODSA|nr:Hypothetical protein, putative [Bodo saltans]|eukprot:CUG91196.1 Hypothetical protein, putative [Bodo saltans]